ncbi:anillin, actin binding protein 2 isoform X3 [Pseudochaenichthys georgianus]|uniref:anillin, actin binding protein 2 isoform X3 n=1 Tax=Pseudochaenichthys georgianus TaxID=52239 RepID=UPI0039C106A4
MEAGEENVGNVMKRQRTPLSDSEDNVLLAPECNDGQKRRRLEASGQENCSPKPSSGRKAELEAKPDTPMVSSVRSRVQQLTQRREGGAPLAQRCLSDPGVDSPLLILQEKGFKEHLLREGEFNQRLERFKVPVFQTAPPTTASSANISPRTPSKFVSAIQQKLQGSAAPSSMQASRIRQQRERELNQLPFQPISENAWLKRSSSDPSLSQQGWTPPGPSSSVWVPRSTRRVCWPPMQPWDMDDDDAVMKDGSFTEASTSGAGLKAPRDCEGSLELGNSIEGQMHMEWMEQNADDGVREEKEQKSSAAQTGTVLNLSFSEDQSFSKAPLGEERIELPSGKEQGLLESTHSEESNMKEPVEDSIVITQGRSGSFEEIDSSYSEEGIEPSTDEELRSWSYPQEKVCNEEESIRAAEQEKCVCVKEQESHCESPIMEKEKMDSVADQSELSDIQHGECYLVDVSAEMPGSSKTKEDEKPRPEEDEEQGNMESCEGAVAEDIHIFTTKQNQQDTGESTSTDDICQKSKEIRAANVKEEDLDVDSYKRVPTSAFAQGLSEVQVSDHLLETGQGVVDGPSEQTHKAEGGDNSKKVTFILEPELIHDSTVSEENTSMESRAEAGSDAELSSHDETNTAEIIDQMFDEVLEYAGRMEEQRRDEDTEDSGIGICSGDKEKIDMESEKEKSEEERESKEKHCDESKKLESNKDELLTFPSSGILSPLSKSLEAVVTPLRLEASQDSILPSLLLTPEETTTPVSESAPLYSIDAYRTQRQNKAPSIQSVTPGVQRRAPEKSRPQPSVNTREKITTLNEEAGKLQNVISQTLQALSCCTDEEHGRGSLEEAEAEKLLLVSCEKRSALLAEVARLREERGSESGEEGDYVPQQPCRGTVSITNIQLPLKVEFVCSSHNRTGRPSHFFFVLIRYGPCNIDATPLATAADAKNGDTISFPTSVILKDIRSSFEIDVEVYSLSHTSGGNSSMDRASAKSRVTPRKLLNTLKRSSHSHSLTSAALPALNPRRSSNFCLVGSHKIDLASLGHGKFPLDKMKLEGKIRRLLGNEFQEKVPFLSPLEGNIYLQLNSEGHSSVQHQGFLTMFEMISGYGVWHRRYFVLMGCTMSYWNHPNDRESKDAEGSISLSSTSSQCVRPVKRDSCARPFTFELVSSVPQQQDAGQDTFAKRWFSADSKEERLDWMEQLNQALLDFHTWNRTPENQRQQSNTCSSGNLRESIL